MTERTVAVGRGISLAYEQFGASDAEPVVLVAGLGQQLHAWPTEFCERLAGLGYLVVRFDNRDVGRSTHLRYRPAGPAGMLLKRFPAAQYDLGDLAEDTVGLLTALGFDQAHLVGMSLGGMVAQTVAARWPARVRTLTSIMSTTGAPRIGRPALSTWLLMAAGRPRSRQEAMDRMVRMYRHIGSHGFPFNERWVRETAGRSWDRDPASAGAARQIAAIFRSGDRTREVRTITAPTQVIHGDRDLMVHPTGGAATARAITGARLEIIRGMGHDLPEAAWPVLLDLIDRNARRGSRPEPAGSSDASTTS